MNDDELLPHERDNPLDRVVLINDFSKVRGGAAALVVLLAEKLLAKNINVTLITGDDGSALQTLLPGVSVVSLNEPPLLDRPAKVAAIKGWYNSSANQMVANWIAHNDTPRTVYHVHNWTHILSASVFRALHDVRHRTVMHAHDYFLACPNGAFVNYQSGRECQLAPLSVACLATDCDRRSYTQKLWRAGRHAVRRSLWDFRQNQTSVLLIHDGMREPFERAGIASSQLQTVRNPSLPFLTERVRAEENKEYVFIGRVEEEKGVADFLAAARAAGVPARVIGDGSALPALRDAFPHVAFDGWQSREGIAALIGKARMLVVASRYPEPFGLVIVESLASGLPVILPVSALLSQEVTQSGIGMACDTRSVEALSRMISQTRADDADVERMSKMAFSMRDQLSATPDRWSEQLTRQYHELLRTARASIETAI
jgi:glycosyltransferase involved in cell wall biosynthesis